MHAANLNVFTIVETPVLEHYIDSDAERNCAPQARTPMRPFSVTERLDFAYVTIPHQYLSFEGDLCR